MAVQEPLKILLVEDNEFDRDLIVRQLRVSGLLHEWKCIETMSSLIPTIKEFTPDLILCDFSLPGFDAFAVLEKLKSENLEIPVIVVTGTLTDETAVECLKRGAADYLLKDKIVRLKPAIENALELRRSRRENTDYQQQLKDSEMQLRTITSTVHALLIYIDNNLRIRFCNQLMKSWLGREPTEVIGQSIDVILGKTIADQIRKEMPTLATGELVEIEATLENGKPESRVVTITLNAEFIESRLNGIVCLFTDISDRKRYEKDLQTAKAAADAANEAKTLFLANVSHEMRTPLSAMVGFAELLLSPQEKMEDRIVWAEKIRNNCRRLKDMIDEILDLSKIEAGKIQVDKTTFEITSVIGQTQSMLLPIAKEKNLQLLFQIDGPIPERIHTDEIKLRHILTNIVGNAIKFSAQGSVVVTLRMPQPKKFSITVEDTGRGISSTEARNLFQPFSQGDNSMTRQFGGTGLGLALARRFAQGLGGDVQLVKSSLGVGSTFEITFEADIPLQTPYIEKLPGVLKHRNDNAAESGRANLLGFKILLVEDSLENQFIVKRFLEKAGAKVDVAGNGAEGVKSATTADYDLVLMDIQMPVLDGYGATIRLRQMGYNRPIVALTAHALKEERDRCLRMGFTGFVTKPIERAEIITEVLKYKPVEETIHGR